MPTLDFKGKSFVYAHHLSVPFRELVVDAKKSLPAKGQKPSLEDNLIIHGDNLLADGLPAFDALAKYVFFTATGRTLSDVPKQTAKSCGFIGETDVYRVHLHYQADKAWLQSNAAALTENLEDDMIAANKGKKKLLVFAAAKFMSQRELSRQGVDFCQLPYAIHRILGD